MPIAPGTRLGPYEVTALIGTGGMGEVHKARDTRLDRTVAIKVLPPELAADPDRRARFEREARAISHLSHPHICTLFDVGSTRSPEAVGGPDIQYLVMEYLEGETLAAAHKAGIIHRDLKPGNVMPTPSGIKVLDFGWKA